jgi:serine/threonine protein kinase
MTKASESEKEPQAYPSDALNIDTKLNGYRIQSILGRGAFGITYLAREEHLDRLVAVKEYLPVDFAVRDKDSSVHPRTESHDDLFQYGLESFLKEARTLVKFKHPNIVQVFTYLEQNETAYLVMEYEVGEDLNHYFKQHPRLSESELLAIFTPVNEGLDVVHQHGFIHRDIKPDNIYIRQDQSPVLLDFGAARDVVKTKSEQLTRILTEGYAPYEQYNPAWAEQGPWTDIYALGATLYLAVMGRKPIIASERAAAYMRKDADPYIPALKTTNTEYSRPFLAAIDRALAFHPKDRPQSLTEWNQMLKADLDATVVMPSTSRGKGDAIDTTFNTGVESQAIMPASKQLLDKRLLSLVAVASIIVLAVIAGGYYFWKSDEQATGKQENGFQVNIPEDLVNSAMIFAKTACWHYAQGKKSEQLIEKIKTLPSTSDRTRFIADQMKKINESEDGFEKNFSQYSISVIKLRRYPVDSIKQAIGYFLQQPDYRNDQTYNTIAEVMTDHATGEAMNTETWKNDFTVISVKPGVFN